MSMELHDNTENAKKRLKEVSIAWLHEACGELEAQVKRNQRVRTGRTKGSWRYMVDDSRREGIIASDSDNALYEEFGTGEFALSGNGRKSGWWYKDESGRWHFTKGKKPQRPLYLAWIRLKNVIISRAEELFKGL